MRMNKIKRSINRLTGSLISLISLSTITVMRSLVSQTTESSMASFLSQQTRGNNIPGGFSSGLKAWLSFSHRQISKLGTRAKSLKTSNCLLFVGQRSLSSFTKRFLSVTTIPTKCSLSPACKDGCLFVEKIVICRHGAVAGRSGTLKDDAHPVVGVLKVHCRPFLFFCSPPHFELLICLFCFVLCLICRG